MYFRPFYYKHIEIDRYRERERERERKGKRYDTYVTAREKRHWFVNATQMSYCVKIVMLNTFVCIEVKRDTESLTINEILNQSQLT